MKEISESNILVVDDNEVNLDVLVDALGDTYTVSVATDGFAALEAVAENPPDLVLLDVMMPGMDGYEVCEKLKASRKTRSIPVIFVTAQTEIDDEIKGFAAGAVDYITKPISPPVVKARVATHLKLRNSERQLRELLEKTLGGTVGMLTNMLSIANPSAFSRASRVARHVKRMAEALKMGQYWQIQMSAMLSQIGCITLTPETIDRIHRGEEVRMEERDAFDRHPRVGYALISRIPNLKEVAEMVVRQHNLRAETDGGEQSGNLVRQGSRMLKLALDFETKISSGKSPSEALALLRSEKDVYGDGLFKTFSRIMEADSSPSPIQYLHARELTPGMVIKKDIMTIKGKLLIGAGTEVTLPVFETLNNFARTGFIEEPFEVLMPQQGTPPDV